MALVDDVARQLKAIQGDKGYREIAREARLDPANVYRVFTGARNVTLNTLEKVATACGCEVNVTILEKPVEKS
jgi:DNA-binding phage protein